MMSVPESAKEDYSTHYLTMNPGGVNEATYRACARYYDCEIKPLLPADRNVRVVEVGCGLGHLIRYLHEQGFSRVGGVEFDGELHRLSSEYVGAVSEFLVHGHGRDFLRGHAAGFDVVLLVDVIEHFSFEEGAEMLAAAYDALRPGGAAILRTPNMANVLAAYSRYMDLTHQAGYTEFSLIQVLRKVGFREAAVHIPVFSGSAKGWVCQKVNRALHRFLYVLHDRVMPKSFEKNVVVWARKGE